ncbi:MULTISPECIES: SDR family oxidoreductase [unclassified Frankia]|uniref:SDR family oxidoreductase n=1 Tax=unclassified Frankia TaxID=2632575 RepID=UPI002AD38A46|nr:MULTISPECIES: SDR family oxidoreductase [unclassified Frankia]
MTTTASPTAEPNSARLPAPTRALPLPHALADARVLVIGGSVGIGLAAADLLAGIGADVILAARDSGRLATVAGQLAERHDRKIDTGGVDVTDPATVEALFASIGTVDHVFVSAAMMATGVIAEVPDPTRDVNITSRLFGAHHVARAAAPRMPPGGSLTFTSGVFIDRPAPGVALGAASLGAIEAYTRALAVELRPLRVNAVRPGSTDTPLFRTMIGAAEGPAGQAAVAAAGATLPLGRVATAAEVAAAALFFMANSYVTGTIVTVDGGSTIA